MNLTLSADENLVRKAREYAAEHGTSLNRLVRSFLERLVGDVPREEAGREFAAIASGSPGNSYGQKPRRDEIYEDRLHSIASGGRAGHTDQEIETPD